MTNKTFFKQVGGQHYKVMKIQPSKFINENQLPFAEGNAIKDPRLSNRPDMKTMTEYLAGRERVRAALATRESQSLDNESNADIKAAWDEFIGDLIDKDVTFNRIYTRYLERDDLRRGL